MSGLAEGSRTDSQRATHVAGPPKGNAPFRAAGVPSPLPILLSIIGDIGDFDDEGKLAAYFGIVPSVSNSNVWNVSPVVAYWAKEPMIVVITLQILMQVSRR